MFMIKYSKCPRVIEISTYAIWSLCSKGPLSWSVCSLWLRATTRFPLPLTELHTRHLRGNSWQATSYSAGENTAPLSGTFSVVTDISECAGRGRMRGSSKQWCDNQTLIVSLPTPLSIFKSRSVNGGIHLDNFLFTPTNRWRKRGRDPT